MYRLPYFPTTPPCLVPITDWQGAIYSCRAHGQVGLRGLGGSDAPLRRLDGLLGGAAGGQWIGRTNGWLLVGYLG